MAQQCAVCGRKAMNSATRSHSNIKTKKKQRLNLQSTMYANERVKACTSCIKSMHKAV